MRVRWSVSALATFALGAGACADPIAPVTQSTTESPSLSVASLPSPQFSLASNLNGSTFLETFDLYNPLAVPTDTTWRAGPVLWLPNDARGPAATQDRIIDPGFISPTYDRSLLGNWAIAKHSRDEAFWERIEGPFMAWHHPTNCDAPPLDHPITSYEESVFFCRNHMMTAVNSSVYGATYLTPDRMVDYSSGTATVRFDVATLRNTKNDWIDLWITPYDYNLVTPLDEELKSTDMQGEPRYGLHIRMTADDRNVTAFKAFLILEHRSIPIPVATTAGYETRFPQSATVRQRFELQLSRTRLKFGMPSPVNAAAPVPPAPIWWIDTPIIPWPATNGVYRAVVQLGHHSLNPRADGGTPTTWHWDNIGISPAAPFTIINATSRYANPSSPSVTLRSPAPSGARVRFAAHGNNMEVSFDGGSWRDARRQAQELNLANRFRSYWMSIPAGTRSIRFRGAAAGGFSKWFVRDISVWAGGETSNNGNEDDDDDDDD